MKKSIELELQYEPIIGFAIGYDKSYEWKIYILILCFVINVKFLKKKKKK
tara:strand:- start:865 stop:1014 length:150 start_codon:yes stop_codon:yes gene_type:complete